MKVRSIKNKGSAFEKDVAYNIKQYIANADSTGKIYIPKDNLAGIDIIFTVFAKKYYVECKHHALFRWNELEKIFNKTYNTLIANKINSELANILLIFKLNNVEPLVMHNIISKEKIVIEKFSTYFGKKFEKRPKGYRLELYNE